MRWFQRVTADWVPPQRPACSCPEHVDDLTDLVVPVTVDDYEPKTVGELIAVGALGAVPLKRGDRWLDMMADTGEPPDERIGPFHWVLGMGDEARLCYHDDAPLSLDQALLARSGVRLVQWMDREEFLVGAPTLCASGMVAVGARALADPRVRRVD